MTRHAFRTGSRLALLALAATLSLTQPARAQEPYLSELRSFGFNFCPRGWDQAAGQILPINQNQALFSLLGTQFGGDGRTTFALPDLRGRAAVGWGQQGSDTYTVGQKGGLEAVTLTVNEMPAHSHTVTALSDIATTAEPQGAVFARSQSAGSDITTYAPPPAAAPMHSGLVSAAGGSQPHDNRMPYLVNTWCIATRGIFPSRN